MACLPAAISYNSLMLTVDPQSAGSAGATAPGAGDAPRPAWRSALLWVLGIVLPLGLVVFCAAAWSWHRNTEAVLEVCQNYRKAKTGVLTEEEAIRRLGGPERAAARLGIYLRLPKRFAPRSGEAFTVLGNCGDAAVPQLAGFLKSGDAGLRNDAATALGWTAGRAAIPHLLAALKDPDRGVRISAARSLEKHRPPAPGTVEALSAALDCPDSLGRGRIAESIGRLGPAARPAVPALTRLLRDPDADVRFSACIALSRIGPGAKAAVPRLIETLRSHDGMTVPNLRSGAMRALESIGRPALPALLTLAREGTKPVDREMAVILIGRLGPQVADEAGPLLEKLSRDDPDPKVRARAGRALRQLRSSK